MFIQAFRWKSVKERWWCLKRKKCTSQNPSSLTRTYKEYSHKVKPNYSCFKYTKCSYIKCDAMFYGKMSMFSLGKDLSALLFNSTEKGWYLCFKIRLFYFIYNSKRKDKNPIFIQENQCYKQARHNDPEHSRWEDCTH